MAEERRIEGRILKGIGGFYYVIDKNGVIHECRARGKFRKDNIKPIPGDSVTFKPQDKECCGYVEDIHPRKNELIRPRIANVDQVVITMAVKKPKPDLMLIDKLLVMAHASDIKPIILINKIDLASDDEIEELVNQYKDNYQVLTISCKNKIGLDKLKLVFRDNITCFAGQSAVGKSSVLNNIFEELDLEVGGLSKKTDRGRHTTRQTELIMMDDQNAIVADTPGFSMLDNIKIKKEELDSYFPEIFKYVDGCRFSSCLHDIEPDCSVRDAVENGLINTKRYERYIKMINEMKNEEEKTKW